MDILDVLTANKVIDKKTLASFREEMRIAHVTAEQVAKKHGIDDASSSRRKPTPRHSA